MGSCAGRIFVLWLPTEPDMAVRFSGGTRTQMSEYDDPGTDYNDGDTGDTGDTSGENIIVAEYSDGHVETVGDVNHDGYADFAALDHDGDGHPEVIYTNEYGGTALDTANYDYNEDGNVDAIVSDRNEDGHADLLQLDRNHDGAIDSIVADNDFDGRPDHLLLDRNYDGRADLYAADPDEDGKVDLLVTDSDFDGTADTVHYGDPDTNPLGQGPSPFATH